MSWENILKSKGSLTSMHFRNLRKAVMELSNIHSDLLENASTYKKEIIELASNMYSEEIGEISNKEFGQTKFKYNLKFRHVIGRIVNSIKRERDIE